MADASSSGRQGIAIPRNAPDPVTDFQKSALHCIRLCNSFMVEDLGLPPLWAGFGQNAAPLSGKSANFPHLCIAAH
ncbi:hypothetical protein [Aestuariivirga sp.]|uniref:hypothetical protein n=1 Tax=Aestuariivirga sp. TaxID=2650926 RepID=UPI0039E4790B